MHTLVVSDVPGDDPVLVASGPTVATPFTPEDAEAVLARYDVSVSDAVHRAIHEAGTAPPSEQPRSTEVICSARQSLEAAAAHARARGFTSVILSDRMEGEAREVGIAHAGIAQSAADCGHPLAPPAVILSGGETSVSLAGASGRGGRNAEFLLGLAVALDGTPGISALACDTDGIDGSETNAGAVIDPNTLERARELGIDAGECLAGHDAFGFFEGLGDLVVTGPTLTNVNDFRAIVIGGER